MLKKILSFLLVLFLLGFLFKNIFDNWSQITSIKWSLNFIDGILIFFFILIMYIINALSWHVTVSSLGIDLGFKKNFKIWIFSNLSRFIPGGIWQYPSRVIMLTQNKVKKTTAVLAVVLESLLLLSIGALTVFISLYFFDLPPELKLVQNYLGFLIIPLSLFFLINQKTFNFLTFLLIKIFKKDNDRSSFVIIPFPQKVKLLAVFSMQFIFAGILLFLLARVLMPLDISLLPIFIGAFTLSWLIGYLTFLAPSGLGVFEVSLAVILSGFMPFTLVGLLAILFRIALILSELFSLSLALLLRKPN